MHVVIVGAGGIGTALAELATGVRGVSRVSITSRSEKPSGELPGVEYWKVDPTDEPQLTRLAMSIGEIDWLINCVGMLHRQTGSGPLEGPEKSVRHASEEFFLANMRVNCLPTMLLAKHMGDSFRHGRPSVFATLSARVGSIGDNRLGGWYSYRASKAALNMVVKTVAHEWRRSRPNVCVAALHPGTVDTELSKPFQSNIPEAGLFSPQQAADHLLQRLSGLSTQDSGRFLAWDGGDIEW